MITLDTETCGLHGPIVLAQWRESDDIHLHEVWRVPVLDTIQLYEHIADVGVMGFNLAFDWFHVVQQWTTFKLLYAERGNVIPGDHISECGVLEADARLYPETLKPRHALDLMLVGRNDLLQVTMRRSPINIKLLPIKVADEVIAMLSKLPLHPLLNAKPWEKELVNRDFCNLKLQFKPSGALKRIIGYITNKETIKFSDILPPIMPVEAGFAPYALALSDDTWVANKKIGVSKPSPKNTFKGFTWPKIIPVHIDHWQHHEQARQYAYDDIVYTELLYDHLECPSPDDVDSILSCQVACCRWRGYSINVEGLQQLRDNSLQTANSAPKSKGQVIEYLRPYLTPAELEELEVNGTGAVILESMTKWLVPCTDCVNLLGSLGIELDDRPICSTCQGTGSLNEEHPVVAPVKRIIEARDKTKKIELLDKLLLAGRLHASYNVIGTLSFRMSGTDSLNPQGIDHSKQVRRLFTLADGELELMGGDFASFEVSIADAICDDEQLRADLCTCAKCKKLWSLDDFATRATCTHCGAPADERQKFHGLFAMSLVPGLSYDDIIATKGQPLDHYDRGKRGGFSQFYGGNANTLVNRLGVTIEVAEETERRFEARYPGVRRFKDANHRDFCSMKQPGGIGTNVIWDDPLPYAESLTGHKRYFETENSIAKFLFSLSSKLPKWSEHKEIVSRREHKGPQTIRGATMSALYAAAFNVQSKAMRAAGNHKIQCTGGVICKRLQAELWSLQPVGPARWHIQPMNIHDEIMAPTLRSLEGRVNKIVQNVVSEHRSLIPLIAIDWSNNLTSWADK